MTSIYVRSLSASFEQALGHLERALQDCPDALWEKDLWPDEASTGPAPTGGLSGSAPWWLAFHALLCLDYDLAGDFEPWKEPPPFDDHTWAHPNRVFTKPELLGYVDWCRGRVQHTLSGFTEEVAARELPATHRYGGTPHALIVGSAPLHVVEHAEQIRQFFTLSAH